MSSQILDDPERPRDLITALGQAIVSPSISCAAVAYCTVGGALTSTQGPATTAVVTDETPVLPTTTKVSLSPASVIYGHGQSERITVSSAAALGVVTGTVTVESGGTAICAATLKSQMGSCTLSATRFGAGTHVITASYGGALGFAPSSGDKSLPVAKAASKTVLTLSARQSASGMSRRRS